MKHTSFFTYDDGSNLKEKVSEWIRDNKENIVEIINIEYSQRESLYIATITYVD